jgi:hypothetical protein
MSNFITPPPNQNLNLQNNHPIIKREDTYWLNRKLFTIHSEDRDKAKWPLSNEFEIECPQQYTNIQSARLTEINFPCNYYNFSNNMQNTKFEIIILTNGNTGPVVPGAGVNWEDISGSHTIDISNGYYTSNQLATTLNYQLNTHLGIDPAPVPPGASQYGWSVVYHETKQKILIGNNFGAEFVLDGSIRFDYRTICCYPDGTPLSCTGDKEPPIHLLPPTVEYFDRYNKWGFLSYIGFTKKIKYYSQKSSSPLVLDYVDENCSCSNQIWLDELPDASINYIEPPKVIDILGETVMYMELNYFNSYDELVPYPDSSYNVLIPGKCGSYYKGIAPGYNTPKYVAYRGAGINSAFAKIPLIATPKTQIFQSAGGFLDNASTYTPPIERVTRFKVKFRYHDGRLVDFQENDFNFTLEINQLRNDFDRKLVINQPQFYSFT